ncbi:NAD(P)/FAD-dependent oxidoreductase [Candidatus Acetothermia bacterium]|nr:NAD(P)/FAD-dependent oxidoreductase [Candidatus Acetothermia bacterium]
MIRSTKQSADVIIIGAGHNGLVASIFLARHGLDVLVLEEKEQVGGAAKTEYPFKKAPLLGTSTGAYLLGLMPPELMKRIGVDIPVIRRDPHYFLPTFDNRYLLFGSDQESTRQQFVKFFSEADWKANQALNDEIGKLRDDVAPAWLEEPLSAEATAERHIRPELRKVFLNLVKNPVEEHLDRFGFKNELLIAMYAVTDAFSGLNATFGMPGTGHNFLAHNMCRLPGADGTWMIVRGGMGTVTKELARVAVQAGVRIATHSPVTQIDVQDKTVRGVTLKDGREIYSEVVVSNADPFRTLDLAGTKKFPESFVKRVNALKRDGTTMKVNLALKSLPKFTCLPENRGQHSTTTHLLPIGSKDGVIAAVKRAYQDVKNGKLSDFPTIEWYIHTTADPSLQDAKGHHNSALFVQWVPYELADTTWEKEEENYVKHLLSIADRFAPDTSDLVIDTFTLTPPKIEKHFGITRGHIQHVDNTFAFDQRMPYATPIQGLYSCSAGCHPAGSVVGAAGHNAAHRVLRDMGL